MKSILLGIPSYNAHRHDDTNERLEHASKLHKVRKRPESGSFLPYVFNKLWCEALNGYKVGTYDYFVMLHADVIPEFYFVDKLVNILQENSADIVSVVIPLKENTGITSTALGGDGPWEIKKRLTLKEVHRLPPTFCAKDCGHKGPLLVNTGCFIVDLSKEWTKTHYFTMESDIIHANGKYEARATRPEDWNMSRNAYAAGARVYATYEVEAYHFGNMYYGNNTPYGIDSEKS